MKPKSDFITLNVPRKIIRWAKLSLIFGYILIIILFLGITSQGIYSNLGLLLALIIGVGLAYLILKPIHWIVKNS